MSEKKSPMAATIPAVKELRKVPGFNPLSLLRCTMAPNGEKVLKLDLRYKRLWFRLACPNGRMVLNTLRITDQMAIFEARLYADKNDPEPLTSFTSTQNASDAPEGRYVQAAQDAALNEVLDNAGFGIQLCDIAQVSDGSGFGSEIPLSKVNAVKQTTPPSDDPPKEQPVEMPKQNIAPAEVPAQEPVEEKEAPSETVVENHSDEETLPVKQAENTQLELETLAGDLPQEEPSLTATPSEETPEEAPPASELQSSYTEDMTVEEICAIMTLEEAREIVVPMGVCKGWTLGQVADQRRASLKWYIGGCPNASNILKAGASLLLNTPQMQKAG